MLNRKRFLQSAAAAFAGIPLLGQIATRAANARAEARKHPVTAPALPPGAWTLAVVPDTQSMVVHHPEVFVAQTQWIVTNQGRYNIRFVVHEGDIVDTNTHPEWLHARRALDHLVRAKIPFALVPGNHDLGRWGKATGRETLLNDYFTFWDYAVNEKVGYFEPYKLENTWHHVSTPTGKLLILALEFGPRDRVLEWANEIAAANSERDIVVVTHAYLYSDSTRYDWAKRGRDQRWNPKSYGMARETGGANDAEEMWTKFVSKHANIRFVLSGHVLHQGTGYLVSNGTHGNRVHQILANYQDGTVPVRGFGGAGILRLMHFMPGGKTVEVKTYSPWLEQWLTEPEHQFTVTV